MSEPLNKKIIDSVKKSLFRSGFLPGGSGILVALSGGADSVVLFLALKQLSEQFGFALEAVHVNHMIRGNEAARDADFCRILCSKHRVNIHIIVENVPQISKERGMGIEEAARAVRYEAFAAILDKNPTLSYVATAHNATDNVETILFHMARGCGLRGLCGIPEVRGRVLRPLLGISKEEIRSSLDEIDEQYMFDSTNDDTHYTRNYIRRELLPVFRNLNKNADMAVAKMCTHLTEDLSFIESSAVDWISKNGITTKISVSQFKSLHPSIARRVIMHMYRSAGGNEMPEEVHIEDLVSMVEDGHSSFIQRFPGGVVAYVEGGRIVFSCNAPAPKRPLKNQEISVGKNVLEGRDGILIISHNPNYLRDNQLNIYKIAIKTNISSATIEGKLYVRERSEGDSYRYGGMTHKLKKLLSDRRLKGIPRNKIPVLCDENGVLWLPGFAARDDGQRNVSKPLYAYYCYTGEIL